MSTMASQITCVSHRSPVDSPHKGQWRGALMFSLIWAWANSREAGDLRHHRAHYDVTVMNDLYSGTGNSLQPVWLQEITSITAASLSSWPLEQTSVKFQSMYSFLWFKFHDTVFPDIYNGNANIWKDGLDIDMGSRCLKLARSYPHVSAVLYAISCYAGPYYNDTWLYFVVWV